MRFPSSSPLTSWVSLKQQGKTAFERGDYATAVTLYSSALQPELECPATERQIILSNIVACRLKLGGPAQAEAAIEAAKQCIACNPQWAKGHVRLASAYIALGDHSNDACNALQRALQLDPGNSMARQMLLQELRRDRFRATTAPPEDQDEVQYSVGDDNDSPTDNTSSRPDTSIDDTISWKDKLAFYWGQLTTWYQAQGEDKKTMVQVFVGLLVLYIAFGGRFGLELTRPHQMRGNYDAGNIYDQYYGRTTQQHSPNSHYNPRTFHQDNNYHTPYSRQSTSRQDNYHDQSSDHRSSFGSFLPNLLDGSLSSMMMIGAMVWVCYRQGIHPFQALAILNLMRGRRGFGRPMGFGHRGMYGGFGRPFGRPRRW